MIVMISSQKPDLESPINERFGRSPYLIKVETQTISWESFSNPGISQSGGAGVAAAQFVIDQKAEAVISGDFGPNASRALSTAGVHMYLFDRDITTVLQAVENFKEGKLPMYSKLL